MANKTKLKVSPEGKNKMMKHFNYTGDPRLFTEFLAADPAKQHLVKRYFDKAKTKYKKYQGGIIGYATGGLAEEQAKLSQMNASIKGSGGDYSDLSSFDNYDWSNAAFTKDEWKAQAAKAGAGSQDKSASDMNVKYGAGAGAYAWDGTTPTSETPAEETPAAPKVNPVEKQMQDQATNPQLTGSQTVTPTKIKYDSDTQDIKEGTGKLDETDPQATVKEADKAGDVTTPTKTDAKTYTTDKSEDAVKDVDVEGESLDKDKIKKVDAEQQTESSVSDLEAEQGEGIKMDDPKKRTMQEGEEVSGSTVDKDKVSGAFGTGEAKAASVKDELTTLMEDFEGGNTPPWAAGAMRGAMATLNARGLGASSLAGQAIIQAAMESALPIAQMEAGNKQQMAIEKARHRASFMKQDFDQKFQTKVLNAAKVSEIANMNFTAEQTVALENSRIANTMNLANLNNKQALVMAEAAALSQLDITNLNNRQQAAVQNAQNFLAVDMANLSNDQQASMLKAQASINAILSDTAATNAAKQFNASSENQMTQFYDNLGTQVGQFNAAQTNAMNQFNAGQSNATSQFNTQIKNQRDQFNSQNSMVIAQSNVQWRRAIATGDTAAINRANELNAQNLVQMSQMAYQNIWQQYGDSMERAWRSSESDLDRMTSIATTKMQIEGNAQMAEDQRNADSIASIGGWLLDFIF